MPEVCEGSRVKLLGLKAREDLNGKYGTAKTLDTESGRWVVQVQKECIKVKPANLELVTDLDTAQIAEEDTGVFLKAKDLDGNEYYVEPGKLKESFNRVCQKYGLTTEENAGKLADILTSTEKDAVTPKELGEMFGMTQKDAFTFLQWINVGVSFKEQVLDPSAQSCDLGSMGAEVAQHLPETKPSA
eukprot:1112820-Prorocentrum_minimum.AAC.4